jgi:hypothetical protein
LCTTNLPGIIAIHIATERPWPLKFNVILTTLSCGKCLADNLPLSWLDLSPLEDIWGSIVSPVLGTLFGAVSLVPLIANVNGERFLTAAETFTLCSGLCSATSGTLTILTAKFMEPDTREIAVLISASLTMASGELTTVGALVTLKSLVVSERRSLGT